MNRTTKYNNLATSIKRRGIVGIKWLLGKTSDTPSGRLLQSCERVMGFSASGLCLSGMLGGENLGVLSFGVVAGLVMVKAAGDIMPTANIKKTPEKTSSDAPPSLGH